MSFYHVILVNMWSTENHSSCITQEVLCSTLWLPRKDGPGGWRKTQDGGKYMHTYVWSTLLYNRNEQHCKEIILQLKRKTGKGRQKGEKPERGWWEKHLTGHCCLWRRKKRPRAKECGWPSEARKSKKTGYPSEPPERRQIYQLVCSSMSSILDFWLPEV